MTERAYQAKLVKKIRARFPGCVLIKNDPSYQQGIPDWTLLWRDKWAMLEVKADEVASVQPNQVYFVEQFDEMSFAAFIHPGNEEEVLSALQDAFGLRRRSRVSKS